MGREVLIVDDEEDIRAIISESIGHLFTRVHEAGNGIEALEVLKKEKPSLIITDFNMPELDGVELIKMIKSTHRNIPIIVLTGRGSQEVRRLVWAYGIWEYFEKPFDLKEFVNCVKKVIATFPENFNSLEYSAGALKFGEISVVLDKNTYEPFEQKALNMGLAPSSLVKILIEDYLKKNPPEK